MRDFWIDQQCEKAEAFVRGWQKFNESWPTLQSAGSIRQQDEQEFRQLQSQLVELWESVTREGAEGGDALGVLRRTVSLRAIQELTQAEARQLEKDWHAVRIDAEARRGRLQARQAELAAVNVVGYWLKKVFGQPLVIVALMLLWVAIAFYMIHMLQWLPLR